MSKRTTIAVDIAKNVFEIAVSEVPGKVSERKRLSRGKLLAFFAERSSSTVVLEACGMAHHWGRKLLGLGHDVVLLPPNRIRHNVSRNKTDRTDAKGLLEAYPTRSCVPYPSRAQISRRSWPCTGCVPPGSPPAPLASTPCAASCASSGW